jgi:hypothetical protein
VEVIERSRTNESFTVCTGKREVWTNGKKLAEFDYSKNAMRFALPYERQQVTDRTLVQFEAHKCVIHSKSPTLKAHRIGRSLADGRFIKPVRRYNRQTKGRYVVLVVHKSFASSPNDPLCDHHVREAYPMAAIKYEPVS